jgi:hypothetical protein
VKKKISLLKFKAMARRARAAGSCPPLSHHLLRCALKRKKISNSSLKL